MSGGGFSNPVTNALGVLIRELLKSVNYSAGVSGWMVSRDGDAEFNDVVIRGEIIVTDPDGSYVRIFDDNPGNGATIEVKPADLVGHTITAGYIYGESDPLAGFPYMLIRSPQLDASDTAFLLVQSGDVSVGQGSYITLQATQQISIKAPSILASGPIHGKTPATTYDNPTVETWHLLAPTAPWANRGAGFQALRYRAVASPPNTVQVVGELTPGGAANGSSFGTLPVGYRPIVSQAAPAGNGGAVGGSLVVSVGAGGSMNAFANGGFGVAIQVNMLISLD